MTAVSHLSDTAEQKLPSVSFMEEETQNKKKRKESIHRQLETFGLAGIEVHFFGGKEKEKTQLSSPATGMQPTHNYTGSCYCFIFSLS